MPAPYRTAPAPARVVRSFLSGILISCPARRWLVSGRGRCSESDRQHSDRGRTPPLAARR